jgi:hypothetical protein
MIKGFKKFRLETAWIVAKNKAKAVETFKNNGNCIGQGRLSLSKIAEPY